MGLHALLAPGLHRDQLKGDKTDVVCGPATRGPLPNGPSILRQKDVTLSRRGRAVVVLDYVVLRNPTGVR